MHSHMSEILSWALEPLADALLPKSSEVISNEDLKSNIDSVNKRNGNWIPDKKLEGNLRDVQSMMEAEMEMPGWCQCEECLMSEEKYEGDMMPTKPSCQEGEPGPTHSTLGGQEMCVPEVEVETSNGVIYSSGEGWVFQSNLEENNKLKETQQHV